MYGCQSSNHEQTTCAAACHVIQSIELVTVATNDRWLVSVVTLNQAAHVIQANSAACDMHRQSLKQPARQPHSHLRTPAWGESVTPAISIQMAI